MHTLHVHISAILCVINIHTYIHTYIHIQAHYIHTYMHSLHVHISAILCVINIHIHTYIHTYICKHTTYIHTQNFACSHFSHAVCNKHTHIHTYIHTYIYKHTTCIHTCILCMFNIKTLTTSHAKKMYRRIPRPLCQKALAVRIIMLSRFQTKDPRMRW
jgi:hypothetical protein